MDRRAQITATPRHLPSILVVLDPAWPALFNLCLSVASSCGVLLHRCATTAAATIAAERRPLAIITSNTVYALDPREFDALARDVRATLLRLDEEVTERELEAMLSGALRETGRRDEGDGDVGGRYTVISSRRSEAPGARRSEMPGPQGTGSPQASRSVPPPSTRSVDVRGDVRSSLGRSVTPSSPPPSVRGAALAARMSTVTDRSTTPVPSSVSPQSFQSPPSSSSRLPPPPSSSRLPPPPSSSRLPPPPSTRTPPTQSFAGPSSSPPRSTPPPSIRSWSNNAAPEPPSSRRLPGPPTAPRSKPSPVPPSSPLPGPPSVRAIPSVPLQNPERPPSIRTMTPLSQRMSVGAPGRDNPSPRSGVRERGSEELDAVFEEQKLPLDALAQRNRGIKPR